MAVQKDERPPQSAARLVMLLRSNMTLIQVTDLQSRSTVTSSGHHGHGNFRAPSVEGAAGVLLARPGIGNRWVAAVD